MLIYIATRQLAIDPSDDRTINTASSNENAHTINANDFTASKFSFHVTCNSSGMIVSFQVIINYSGSIGVLLTLSVFLILFHLLQETF